MPEHKKEIAKCVEVNILVKCEDHSWRKEKETPCVVVNIEVECGGEHDCGKFNKPCEEY